VTVDAWVTDIVLGVMLLATGFGVLAGIPREVVMAWWMRVCGWERDAANRNGGNVERIVPARRAAPIVEEPTQRFPGNGE